MEVSINTVTVEKMVFKNIKNITDPVTVMIDHENRRVTIHHYDGTVSANLKNYRKEIRVLDVLQSLNEDQLNSLFGFESGGLRQHFYLHDSIEKVKRVVVSKVGKGSQQHKNLIKNIDEIEAETVTEFITAVSELDKGNFFKDAWQEINCVVDVPPFVRFINRKFFPRFQEHLRKQSRLQLVAND